MNDSPFRISLTCSTVFLLLLGSLFAAAQGPTTEVAARLSEQTVYVPYDKLEEIFEKEGRGVFLPPAPHDAGQHDGVGEHDPA